MSEAKNNQPRVMKEASKCGAVVFRNHTGLGWQGKYHQQNGGTVILQNARPLMAGLCKGSSDLIGWHTVTITKDMIGQDVAIFTAIEVKGDRGRPTAEQKNFIEAVNNAGGIAFIARDERDVRNGLCQK